MAYKMKNPGLARQCRVAGAGSPARHNSPVKLKTGKDKVQSDYSKMVNDDSEHGGLSKKQIRQAERAEKKELRKQGKEQAQELKRFGGDQAKLDAYNAKKAERKVNREDELYNNRKERARLGLGYNVLTDDNEGYSYVSSKQHRDQNTDTNNDGVISQKESLKYATDIKGRSTDLGTDFGYNRSDTKSRYGRFKSDMEKAKVDGGSATPKRKESKEHRKGLRKAKRQAIKTQKQKYKQAKKEIKSYTDY